MSSGLQSLKNVKKQTSAANSAARSSTSNLRPFLELPFVSVSTAYESGLCELVYTFSLWQFPTLYGSLSRIDS